MHNTQQNKISRPSQAKVGSDSNPKISKQMVKSLVQLVGAPSKGASSKPLLSNSASNNSRSNLAQSRKLPMAQLSRAERKLYNSSVEKSMLSHSGYFRTIADPFNFRGVQIPDLTMYPSVPFSITDRRSLKLDTNGNGYVCYGISGVTGSVPHGSLVPQAFSTSTSQNYAIGMMSNANATTPIVPTTDLFPSGGTVTSNSPIVLQQWQTGDITIPDLFQKVRLVSAGFALDYTGTDLNNQGIITAAFAPRLSIIKDNMNNSTANNLATIQNLPDAKVIPVNKNEGAVVLYRPQDFLSLNYSDTQVTQVDSSLWTIDQVIYGGEAYLIVTGGTASTYCQITTVLNYEGIPIFNTADLFAPRVSKSDPLELSATFNSLESVMPVAMGTDEILGSDHPIMTMPQETTSVEHNLEPTSLPGENDSGSFMDSIFSALEGVGEPVKNIVNFAKDITPLVKTAISLL